MELQKKEQPIYGTAKERATYLCKLQKKVQPICVNCKRKSNLSV